MGDLPGREHVSGRLWVAKHGILLLRDQGISAVLALLNDEGLLLGLQGLGLSEELLVLSIVINCAFLLLLISLKLDRGSI